MVKTAAADDEAARHEASLRDAQAAADVAGDLATSAAAALAELGQAASSAIVAWALERIEATKQGAQDAASAAVRRVLRLPQDQRGQRVLEWSTPRVEENLLCKR
eukprot:4238723-Amphidinium_carterae.1